MVLSPALTSSVSKSKLSSRPEFNCNSSESSSTPYFASTRRNNFNPLSSTNSISPWCNDFIGNNGYPSTSATLNRSRLYNAETNNNSFKTGQTIPFNSELSAERRRFNRISLGETNNYNNIRHSFGINMHGNWRESSQNFNNNTQPRRQSLVSNFNLSIRDESNETSARNRVILERRRAAEPRRPFNIINSASTSTINISNRDNFHLRVTDRSPFSVLSPNFSNNQNFNSTTVVVNSNPEPIIRPVSIIHTAATISAARKRSAAAFKRLNEPSKRIWVSTEVDKTVHLDDRALNALLRAERTVQPNIEHFKMIQTEITETMRRAVVIRMNEVCLRENSDFIVLPLAVSYLDRLLSVQFVPQHNLQALADAALLLAMKMKSPQVPVALNIVDGQQNRLDELFDWELFIVNKLGWALSTPTPFEFFDQLIVRSPILEHLRDAFAQTIFAMLKDLQLACNLASSQAAACLLYIADESKKRHLICESEGTIRKCFQLNTNNCRSYFATNIRFALSDFFFDSERETVVEKELSPPATKRFVLAEELATTSSTLLSDEDKLIVSNNNDSHPEDNKNLTSTTNIDDEKKNLVATELLIAEAEHPNQFDVKCFESWLFDDEEDENENSLFDFSFSSSSIDETIFSQNIEIDQLPTPPCLNSLTNDFQNNNNSESTFIDVLNSVTKIDSKKTSTTKTGTNVTSNHYVLSNENNSDSSPSYVTAISCINLGENDSGFNSVVSTPENTDLSTMTTTLALICSPVVPTETLNNKNNLAYCNNNIYKHQGFDQFSEF